MIRLSMKNHSSTARPTRFREFLFKIVMILFSKFGVRAIAMVETAGELRGSTWVDWNDRLRKPPNCRVVTQVDRDRFLALMGAGLGS